MNQKIIAVVPAYNEATTIKKVLEELGHYTDEIIVVNDASSDGTDRIAKQYAIVLSHTINQGYDRSLDDGFKEAAKRDASIIFSFDADGQHIASELPKILEPIKIGHADVVSGVRPFKQRISERIFAWYAKRKIGISDPLCGIKAYSADAFHSVGYFDTIQSIGTQLLFNCHKKGFRIQQIPIDLNRREQRSRFGGIIKANYRILLALLRIIIRFR